MSLAVWLLNHFQKMIKNKISTDGSVIISSSLITLPPQAKKAVYFYFPERSGSSLLSGFGAMREINQSNNNKKMSADLSGTRVARGPGDKGGF